MPQHIFNLKPSKLDGTEKIFDSVKYAKQELPKTFDLRLRCPPVYDQGQEGSCTANAGVFARVMLLISQLFPNIAEEQAIMLSRAFLYYMERYLEGDTGEDAGASMKDIGEALKKFGVCPESDMPYIVGDYKTAPSDAAKKAALAYKIAGASIVKGITGIKTALATRSQPVLCGMDVYESMESKAVAQTGVLPMPKKWEKMLGGHAVAIVGYLPALSMETARKIFPIFIEKISKKKGNDLCSEKAVEEMTDSFGKKAASPYFIVRNSWGAGWGDKGYFYMPYQYVEKKLANEFWILEGRSGQAGTPAKSRE